VLIGKEMVRPTRISVCLCVRLIIVVLHVISMANLIGTNVARIAPSSAVQFFGFDAYKRVNHSLTLSSIRPSVSVSLANLSFAIE
jgi:hypothetical protein